MAKKTLATKTFVYRPKKQFAPIFTIVWESPKFREELKACFDDFCALSGTVAKLKATPKDSWVSVEICFDLCLLSNDMLGLKL